MVVIPCTKYLSLLRFWNWRLSELGVQSSTTEELKHLYSINTHTLEIAVEIFLWFWSGKILNSMLVWDTQRVLCSIFNWSVLYCWSIIWIASSLVSFFKYRFPSLLCCWSNCLSSPQKAAIVLCEDWSTPLWILKQAIFGTRLLQASQWH